MDLVFNNNGNIATNSLLVAEKFGKNHRDVLSSIDDLIKGLAEKSADLFQESEYVHPQNNQTYRMFIMGRDGFSLLVMGFTGKKALNFKMEYIDAFNTMEETIKTSHLPQSKKEWIMLALKQEEENERLLISNAKLQTKSDIYDKVFKADVWLSGSEVCKTLGLPFGNITFYKHLKAKGVFYKNKNEPMQRFVDSGHIKLIQTFIDPKGVPVLKPVFAQKSLPGFAKMFGVVENRFSKIKTIE